MFALVINAATIIIGSLIGLLIKKKINNRITDSIIIGIGFFTVYNGITALTTKNNAIIYLLALVIGGLIGTVLQFEERIERGSEKLQNKLSKGNTENGFASGFAGFFIMSCVGAYTVVACFNTSIGNNTMLLTKSVMDFVVSLALSASLGIGVMFAGIPIILYEAILILFAGALTPLFSDLMLDAFSCMGAILTIAIGLNCTKISKFKVVNYILSLVFAPLFSMLFEQFGF